MKVYLLQQEEGFSAKCEGLSCDKISYNPDRHSIGPDFSYTSNGEMYKSISCAFCGQHKRANWEMNFV